MKKLAAFFLGIVIGAVATFGATLTYFQKPEKDDDILFPHKSFGDNDQKGEWGEVIISGTLTGRDQNHPNNAYSVHCIYRYKTCFVSDVIQIRSKQIGYMEAEDYPIVKWNDYELVAQKEISINCYRTTFTINRKMQTLLWVDEPINQTTTLCNNSDPNIRKYTIEDAPGWKQSKIN
jgi:hypothetical protein